MCNVDCDPHVREMEAITRGDERQGDDMVGHQFFKVLPRLLQLQQQHDRLLRPVAGLQQIVCLEEAVVALVREAFVHAVRAKVPHRRPAHHVHPVRSEH